ncbi:MAG: hypothetical protein ACUVQT_08490 [bacterium]
MLCWFLFVIGSEFVQDSTEVDSVIKYKMPSVINFSQTGVIDSSLKQKRVIEPVIFFGGVNEIIYFTPYLSKDKGYTLNLIAPYPVEILFHSHKLNNYFLESFNLYSLPINLIRAVRLNNDLESDLHELEFETKVNVYDEPYSYLYFTMFGGSSVYNVDFTRAITDNAGFYLSGLYSRQYKNNDRLYLQTNGGYMNIYYNQFIPSRIDVFFTDNDYGPLWHTGLGDIAVTLGSSFYKIAIFRTENSFEYFDTLQGLFYENRFITYGTNQRMLYYFKDLENIFGLNFTISSFKYDTSGLIKDNDIEFYQKINYKFHRLSTGLGYHIDYEKEKNLYLNPSWRIKYDISDDIHILGTSKILHRRANFVAKYGNENLVMKDYYVQGNPDIRDEKYFHKEIGIQFKSSILYFYHSAISAPVVYRRDSTNYYSAMNGIHGEVAGFELFYEIPWGKYFSFSGVYNYLLKVEPSTILPRTNLKLFLGGQRTTERSLVCLFTRFNYLSDRYDEAGNYYREFWTIAPGLMVKFITLRFNMIIDNILGKKAGDFPNTEKGFNLEVKWEFRD